MKIYLVRVDTFDESPRPIGGADGGAQDAVDVDVVAGDLSGFGRSGFRMVPADQDRLVQLALQGQLTRRRD